VDLYLLDGDGNTQRARNFFIRKEEDDTEAGRKLPCS